MVTLKIGTTAERSAAVMTLVSSGKSVYHQLPNTNYTVCVLTFDDGWSVTGESVCVDPADFNQATGEGIARDNAINDAETHYWRVFGYMAMVGMTEFSYEPK